MCSAKSFAGLWRTSNKYKLCPTKITLLALSAFVCIGVLVRGCGLNENREYAPLSTWTGADAISPSIRSLPVEQTPLEGGRCGQAPPTQKAGCARGHRVPFPFIQGICPFFLTLGCCPVIRWLAPAGPSDNHQVVFSSTSNKHIGTELRLSLVLVCFQPFNLELLSLGCSRIPNDNHQVVIFFPPAQATLLSSKHIGTELRPRSSMSLVLVYQCRMRHRLFSFFHSRHMPLLLTP
jgi:hypothetical protein